MNKFCGNCGARLDSDTKFCGNCGYKVNDTQSIVYDNSTKNKMPVPVIVILAIFGFLIVVGLLAEIGKEDNHSNNESNFDAFSKTSESYTSASTTTTSNIVEEKSTSKTTTKKKNDKTENTITTTRKVSTTNTTSKESISVSKQNAVKKAKDYLRFMAFSKKGLIEQLEFEKFSTEDATYAVEHCGADWNQQAAKKAKEYLNLMAFSRDGLIEQLEFEGFTHEQAVYGVGQTGL